MDPAKDPQSASQDAPKPSNADEQGGTFFAKHEELQKYVPFLRGMIRKLEATQDKVRDAQLAKMKNLFNILTNPNRRMKIDTLMRCEEVLKKLDEKLNVKKELESAPIRKIKTEVVDTESPASPPQPDLTPSKSLPKIIPVERCATVERDFSQAEEVASLEASRSRLKGLMLKSDLKKPEPVIPPPPAQIPGLDMLFPDQETVNHCPSLEGSYNSTCENMTSNQSLRRVEEWKHLDGGDHTDVHDAPSTDLDAPMRDVDDRLLPSKSAEREYHGLPLQPALSLSPAFSNIGNQPSLLPRHMPTHNMGFPTNTSVVPTSGFSQDLHGSKVEPLLQASKSFISSSVKSNAPLLPTPQSDHHFDHHMHSSIHKPQAPSREQFDRPEKVPLLPTPKPFHSSSSRIVENFERKSMPPAIPLSKGSSQGESNVRNVREMMRQKIDKVEKLGVSSGGALRKLKSDIRFPRDDVMERDKVKSVDTDQAAIDQPSQYSNEMVVRKVDPRLEREQRRSSLDDEVQKMRIPPLIPEGPLGSSNQVLPYGMTSFASYGNSWSGSSPLNQSHMTSPVARAGYQVPHSVINTYQWQTTTCTVKQTTAHDLGLRYQPRSRQGKMSHNVQYERSLSSTSLKASEESYRESDCQRSKLSLGQGKRQQDPRILPSKIADERKSLCDPRQTDATSKRKEKIREKDDEEIFSPLGRMYNDDKRSKTGQGYGLQKYKIPKRPKEQSPLKDSTQSLPQRLADPRLAMTRDPRLSRTISRPPSPELAQDTAVPLDDLSSLHKDKDQLGSAVEQEDCSDKAIPSTDDIVAQSGPEKDKSIQDKPPRWDLAQTLSPSVKSQDCLGVSESSVPLKNQDGCKSSVRSPSPCRESSSSRSRGRSRGRSPSHHRAKSRGRSRSRSRRRSTSVSRAKSRGRSSSRYRAKSRGRSTSRSRGATPSRSRARSRARSIGRSRSISRGRSRDRSRSVSRGKFRGKSRSSSRGRKGRSRSSSRGRKGRSRSSSRGRKGRSRSSSRGRSRIRYSSGSRGRVRDRSVSRSRAKRKSRDRTASRSRTKSTARSPSDAIGRSRTSPSKRKSRRSSSRSLSQDRRSSSRHRGKSISRSRHKSRARSISSDSDRRSASNNWKRKESPSPDRKYSDKKKSAERSTRRSVSSGSADSSGTFNTRSRSRGRSRRSREVRRSVSNNSLKDVQKSAASSRSSSCSGRSSPLFPKGRSRSRSPSREVAFDDLLKLESKDKSSSLPKNIISKESDVKTLQGDGTVSSSLSDSTSDPKFSRESVMDMPTSTSENIPDISAKSDVGSSSEVVSENASLKAQSASDAKQSGISSSADPGNILLGIIKSLATNDVFHLAELAASQLPEDKRALVLEIFKGAGTSAQESSNELKNNPVQEEKSTLKEQDAEIQGSEEASSTNVSSSLKQVQSKKKMKTKLRKGQTPKGKKETEVLPQGTEKQPKRRGKNELDKLHEDIRGMFICKEVVSATGQRSCRNKNRDVVSNPKPDEKAKPSRSKAQISYILDSSDDSPLKDQDKSESSFDGQSSCHPRNVTYSSESDDEISSAKWGMRKSKMKFPESESESDFIAADNQVSKPSQSSLLSEVHSDVKVVLQKGSESLEEKQLSDVRNSSRNVARRGRKISSLPRDHAKILQDLRTPNYDGDEDDEEEEAKEDKDMSQIDESNIIQVHGVGNKLTRNQLKLLKGPDFKDDSKPRVKRALNTSKELSESESDASKASESFSERGDVGSFPISISPPLPVKKKRKFKKAKLGCESHQNKEESFGIVAGEQAGKSIDLDSSSETFGDEVPSTIKSDNVKTSGKILGDPSTSSSDLEVHEIPLISRLQNVTSYSEGLKDSSPQDSALKSKYHEDLDYTIVPVTEKANCKICRFVGKAIVTHYVLNHPSEEVIVSRLPKSLANKLKAEADAFQKDTKSLIKDYAVKKRTPLVLKCLICNETSSSSWRLFEHVSTHTGEYSYACTQCDYKAATRTQMKNHRQKHNMASVKDFCSCVIKEQLPPMKKLFGYLCSECNFFQLSKSNLEKHVLGCHIKSPTARPVCVCISEEMSVEMEDISSMVESNEVGTAKGTSEICNEAALANIDGERSNLQEKVPVISTEEDCSFIPQNLPDLIDPECESTKEIGGKPQAVKVVQTNAVDLSVFIGSEIPVEDESKLQEEREKLLKDAAEEVRERPKIRSFMSEKLAQRFQSESSANVCDLSDPSNANLSNQSRPSTPISTSEEKSSTLGRSSLRTTPARLALKSSEASEKRLTRSSSRPAVFSQDLESQSCIAVPEEVKAPLPVSTLHHTLQRMQETIKSPVSPSESSVSSSSVSSSMEITPTSQFVLKKALAKVGFLQAKVMEGAETPMYYCLSQQCTFISKHAFTFLNHLESSHPRKPQSAPCSVCEEDSKILRDLPSSFHHLVKYHLMPANQSELLMPVSNMPPAVPLESSNVLPVRKPSIRPRKFPGDNLSKSSGITNLLSDAGENALPSLVISKVVSLSKDHTPDGVPKDSPAALSFEDARTSDPESFKLVTVLSNSIIWPSMKKDATSLKEMMKFENLCNLFKCIHQNCSFSTNHKDLFTEHYKKHLMEEFGRNVNAASTSFSWQKCLYCGCTYNSGEDLADHILAEHGQRTFQCSGCFYRAANMGCVFFHQRKFHNGELKVLQCPKLKGVQISSPSQLSHTIKPFKCCQGSKNFRNTECGAVFISPDDFMYHHESEHPSEVAFYCSDCELGLQSSANLICHFSASHGYRNYHCLHCHKASETSDEISYHMCLEHPDKPMEVATRTADSGCNAGAIKLLEGLQMGIVNLEDLLRSDSWLGGILDFSNCGVEVAPAESLSIGTPSCQREEYVGSSVEKGKDTFIQSSSSSNDAKPAVGEPSKDNGAGGLSGSSLYVCGYADCFFKAESSSALKEHFQSCNSARDLKTLSCPHCQRVFRQVFTYFEHLPKHGVPRYLCGLCDYRATHPTMAIRHLRQQHKVTATEVIPINPLQSDHDSALHKVRPKEVLKRGKSRSYLSAVNKLSFGPEDKQMLPLSAVFTRDVSCTLCSYTCKVRSNMIRHLEQHELGREPSPVPFVNPVPCLERNEKMFDTMTNHAISSTIPVRRDSNAFKVTDEPKFIPENKRYVCCAPTCQQTSADDTMLRHHIRVLHPEINVYKCPHCPESEVEGGKLPILLEKLGSHLKMHDNRLYSCLSCSYYHYQRYIVERHTSEKHPDQKGFIRVVREPKPDGPTNEENVVDLESEIMGMSGEGANSYECGLCSSKGTKNEIILHAASVHKIHTQYKCSLCNFRSNTRARFTPHFSKNHPNDKEFVIEVCQKSKVDKPVADAVQLSTEVRVPPCDQVVFDATPLWHRNLQRPRHLRGILFEENGLKPKELEHRDVGDIEMPLFSGSKRSASSSIFEETQAAKRERRDDKCLSCPKCAMKFSPSKESDYKEHLRQHFASDNMRYKCSICLKNFQSYDVLVMHITSEHQRLPAASDVVDTHSEEYINSDVTRQILALASPVASGTFAKKTSLDLKGLNPQVSQNSSPNKSKVVDCSSNFMLPNSQSKGPSASSCDAFITPLISASPSRGMMNTSKNILSSPNNQSIPRKAFESPLKDMEQSSKGFKSSSQSSPHPDLTPTEPSGAAAWNEREDDLEVDESALEMDIEEVEDEDMNVQESTALECNSANLSDPSKACEQSSPNRRKNADLAFPCKYKDTHGCHFLGKSDKEAKWHEMKHWEIKPWKCGLCTFQAVQASFIKLHSSRKHPNQEVKLEKNELPASPTILPLSRQKSKAFSALEASPTSHPSASISGSSDDIKIVDSTYDQELFRSLKVFRCGFCRLRETSLSRLLSHWQLGHKSNKTFHEVTPDGRSVVPFKFHEVKFGDHERETMAFQCALCSRSGTLKLLQEHYPSRHPGEKLKICELVHDRMQCSLCPRQFSSKSALVNHFSSDHPGEKVEHVKVKTKDHPDDPLALKIGCLYCFERMETALEMRDHHRNFHSHLDPKYIELEDAETDQSSVTKKSNSPSDLNDVDMSAQSDTKGNNTSRPAVIQFVRSAIPQEESQIEVINSDSSVLVSQPPLKRAVARKSTSKFRSVARKSTGGRAKYETKPNNPTVCISSDSDSDHSSASLEEEADLSRISCPMIIDGIRMRVSLETLSQYSNIYPTVDLTEKEANL